MEHRGVLTTLAMSFGDGLAFALGMKIAQLALRSGARQNERSQAEVEDRLRRYVDARVDAATRMLGERLPTEASDRTVKLMVDTIELRLLGRIVMLEREVQRQSEIVRSLGAVSSCSQQKLHELLKGDEREAPVSLAVAGG